MVKAEQSDDARARPASNRFGTFGGVFTPSLLTILGVIMFMRSGFVTGQAGIYAAIVILLVSKSITFLTSLSISAISTNTQVKGGGAYFLISRSLGPEFGGAIGLTLFMAQALSVPFYVLGFTEALVLIVPTLHTWFVHIGILVAAGVFVVTYVGADWAIRAQYVILTVLMLGVFIMLAGAAWHFDPATFEANWESDYTAPGMGFWAAFAIFFPAVTGIMAGVNMSGDLADPARSIPRGTLLAVLTGFVIYLAQVLLTGGAQTRAMLVHSPYTSLLEQALFGLDFLIVAGVFAATLSSALGSMMGAPRILQALARDGIFPVLRVFAHGAAKGDEPRRGLWLTLAMSVLTIWAAGHSNSDNDGLNTVASVLTMFFLFAYGMTNLAAFIERFGGNPSFRPRFRYFHWLTALTGAVGCVAAALLIDAADAMVAFLIILGLFYYVERRVLSASFGDARRGFFYARVKANLQRLAVHKPHPKNWRPTTLVLSGNPASRRTLTAYGTLIGSGRGIVTLARIREGDPFASVAQRKALLAQFEAFIDQHGIAAFAEVIVAPNIDAGIASLVQAHSIGPLKPNLIVLGWPRNAERAPLFAQHLRHIAELGMSQLVVVDKGLPPDVFVYRRIDVWWRGRRNGSLMVILAYLLSLNPGWSMATIRVLRIVEDVSDATAAHAEIQELGHAARIELESRVIVHDTFENALWAHSHDATVVFMGFSPPSEPDALRFHASMTALLADMPTTLLIHSSGEADVFA